MANGAVATPSFELKLRRAYLHLNELHKESGSWLDNTRKTMVTEADPNDPSYVVIKVTGAPVDEGLGLLVGDCVQNMRSALDHLAFALAARFSVPLPDEVAKDSQFPIFGDKSKGGAVGMGASIFRDNALKYIRGIDPTAQDIIKGLQPYHRGNAFEGHPLWVLQELSNIDKHRVLHVAVGYSGGLLMRPHEAGAYWLLKPQMLSVAGGIVDGETVVARARVAPSTATIPAASHFGHKVDFDVPLDVVLKEPSIPEGYGEAGVVRKLAKIYEFIATEVVPPLSPFLG